MFTRVINEQLRLIAWALLGAPLLALLPVAGYYRFDLARAGLSGLHGLCIAILVAVAATGVAAFYKATRESFRIRVMFTAGYAVAMGCALTAAGLLAAGT
jgi:hypothetical protein